VAFDIYFQNEIPTDLIISVDCWTIFHHKQVMKDLTHFCEVTSFRMRGHPS